MSRNVFRFAWRSLKRNKLHTAINVGGLIIGFTIGIAVLLVVYSQLVFDSSHKNASRIYEAYTVTNGPDGEEINNQFDFSAGPVFRNEVSGVERTVRFMDGGAHLMYKDKVLDVPVMMADEDVFRMFSFTVVKGNANNPLGKLTDVVLTEETAKMIFGDADPIGQELRAASGDKMQAYTVSAVIKKPYLSSVRFDMLARIENRSDYVNTGTRWDNHSQNLYVELKPGVSIREAENQLRVVDHRYQPGVYTDLAKKGARPDRFGDVFATRLLPLGEAHFSTRVNGHKATSYMMIYTLLIVGLLVIAIASFNFININLAMAFVRSREIGVRKCLGAGRGRLFVQLWGESFLICLFSFLFSLQLTNLLLHNIGGIQRMNIPFAELILRPGFLGLSLVLLLLVSLGAGGYPSWVMARFDVVETLKGKLGLKRRSWLRSGLIVMQFVIACVMIGCTMIVYRQFKYLQDADTGMDKDYVISVPLRFPDKGKQTVDRLRTMLASDPHVVSVSGSNINLGRGADRRSVRSSSTFEYKGRSISMDMAAVEYDYLKTLGVRLVAGRDFDPSFGTDTAQNVLVSESLARELGEKEVVGKTIVADGSASGFRIVGVFADFHLYSMAEELSPLMLNFSKNEGLDYCFVKTTSAGAAATMERVKKMMGTLEPAQEFRGSFLDENINNWYADQQTMSLFFSIAAMIAIVLSCMGLLAMVLLIVNQRVKEIGIRKVLGATVGQISLLVSKEFLFLVGLAVVIATPVSWVIMNGWLRSFAYRIGLEWWMFGMVGVVAMGLAVVTVGFHVVRAAMANPVRNLRAE